MHLIILLISLEVAVDTARPLLAEAEAIVVSTLVAQANFHLLVRVLLMHLIQLVRKLDYMLLLLGHEPILLVQDVLQGCYLILVIFKFIHLLQMLPFNFFDPANCELELCQDLGVLL